MKVLWHSISPLAPTGYGVQTAVFAPRLNALPDVDLAISSGYGLEGSAIDWNGIKVYPGDDWNRCAHQWMDLHGDGEPCLVITLMDVWPLNRRTFKAIADANTLACWTPVDHKPCPTIVTEFLQETGARPIAMSRFGETELRTAGFDPLYVPHGVDTEVYAPYPRDEVRAAFNMTDRFVVGIVANNQGIAPPRKAFSEAFLAFSELHRRHPEALLYIHSEISGFRNGINLLRLAERFEIPPEALLFTNQVKMEVGITSATMAAMYSSFDVLLNASYGEGFGVPIIEAQACGTPVIVTDWTAMPELLGAGWKVGGRLWDDPKQDAFYMAPDIDEILAALLKAHAAMGDTELRDKAREFALAYDADTVTETYWKPALAALTAPREVPPLPNRAMRRAAAKQKQAA